MTLQELLDVIDIARNDGLKLYKVIAVTAEQERYKVRGVWLDHDSGSVILSLSPDRIARVKKD